MSPPPQQFASSPQAVPSRGKYLDDDPMRTNNIMNDKRIFRGNTYATMQNPQDDSEIHKQRDAQKNRLRRANKRMNQPPGTPEAVSGRKHIDIQTDTYLEELTERTIAFEAETMTDFLGERPPSPLFMPAKVGADMETQIEEGDLFDFDKEVDIVLEVLIGKTLEYSMIEVLHEEELAAMKRHQEEYEQMRYQEMLEVRRIEEHEQRRADEALRRKNQLLAYKQMETQLKQKIASRHLARTHLSSLLPRSLQILNDQGLVVEELSCQESVECKFIPWLFNIVANDLVNEQRNRLLVADLVSTSLHNARSNRSRVINLARGELIEIENAELRAQMEEDEKRRLERLEKERLEELERQRAEATDNRIDDEVKVMEFNPDEDATAAGIKTHNESTLVLDEEKLAEFIELWGQKNEDGHIFVKCAPIDGEENSNEGISFRLYNPPPPPEPEENEEGEGEAVEGEGGEGEEAAPPEE